MKLSIITINRNDKEGLEKTIASVINQSFQDYEFIVIDGASTDGSLEVIQSYSSQIHYRLSESDSGIYNAMNKGITKAEGDYLYFLNSGDAFVSDKVLLEVFDNELTENFVCGNIIWNRDGILTEDKSYKGRDWLFSLYDLYSGFLSHQAFFIRKEMFYKYGLYDERLRIMSDWKLFFVAIGINHEKVQYVDVTLTIYDTNGLSSTIGGKAILEEKQMVAKEELSPQVYKELDRLYFLSRHGFWVDFVVSKKWINFISKVFLKICTTLRLVKL
ncbi:glycosyltransferase family 2 protein [Dysgonomonas macrotermitis]|uniref:Glycosyltransferase involved in cell wall bisynthesis n=1 Tax=Dysgonomonas macrotermitis TaxID=1346286 RepID=A0A1M5DUN2_9BACT|nr:glycosyltransferase family 2 protein [Dysgonomonas macrotermitis]SHF70551.1 Glycosyltransferase involved in cell wall bisynthesis [Dysgonomonas macrotermitis]